MIWLAAIAILNALVLYAGWQVVRLQRAITGTERAGHAKCVAHIADVTSRRFIAARLRDLAAKYDSAEEQSTLASLARNKYSIGGPSMPALWLDLQAELLDPTMIDHNEVAEYNMAGERVL